MNYKRSFLSNLSITSWLIIINIIFFLAASILIFFKVPLDYIALKPSNILHGKYLWTFLTSMFMHAGIFHLAINMFVLFSLGSFCERIIGRKRFLWLYLISGIIAGLVFVLLSLLFGNAGLGAKIFGSPEIAAVGASGAIFAIAGLFVILIPKARFIIIFFPFMSFPGYILIPVTLALMWVVSALSGLPIGNTAHLGGFLAGLIYGFYLRQKYPKKVILLNRQIR